MYGLRYLSYYMCLPVLVIFCNIFICGLHLTKKVLSFMHQSIPAMPRHTPPPATPQATVGTPQATVGTPQATVGHLPRLACQSQAWGICNICAARGSGICQPRDQPRASDTHACFLSEYNYTDDFTGKTSRLAHLSRRAKNWRGL